MANSKIERDAAVGGGGVTGRERRETYVKPRLNEFGRISDLTAGGSQPDTELMMDGRLDERRAGRMS